MQIAFCRSRTAAVVGNQSQQVTLRPARHHWHRRTHIACATSDQQHNQLQTTSLKDACARLDAFLGSTAPEAEQQALQLVDDLQQQGVLPAFGRGQQLPKRIYTMDELRLNKVEPTKLLSPTDESLNSIRNKTQLAALAGLIALGFTSDGDISRVLGTTVAVAFTLVLDQVANSGGGEALIVDTIGRLLMPSYGKRVAYHEAGHFLVAYLVGILPAGYTLTSLDAFLKYRVLNIQAGCRFCETRFQAEVASGKLTSTSLSRYSCVALAGVVTEYLRFGQAEGGVGDIMQLDGMFQGLGFTQMKADSEVRWAVLNVAQLLRQHEQLHDQLAEAMMAGKSVGECIALVEKGLAAQQA